jgi:hypothetical protein
VCVPRAPVMAHLCSNLCPNPHRNAAEWFIPVFFLHSCYLHLRLCLVSANQSVSLCRQSTHCPHQQCSRKAPALRVRMSLLSLAVPISHASMCKLLYSYYCIIPFLYDFYMRDEPGDLEVS